MFYIYKLSRKFKLIYQEAHHNVYCNMQIHLKTQGGNYHKNEEIDWDQPVRVDSVYPCDCDVLVIQGTPKND